MKFASYKAVDPSYEGFSANFCVNPFVPVSWFIALFLGMQLKKI
mgnify:CR=1 FL=1